ncbi:MAG: hypothetical protein M3268_02935, partial [Acidobacteriota bacterium]|nr:hypothetical protein [Acidobacteriota bacterium]
MSESNNGGRHDGNGHGGDATDAAQRDSRQVRLPNSRRVYIQSGSEGVRVPFREVSLNATRRGDGTTEVNEPVRVYETSGPWGDAEVKCDEREGLAPLRREWIVARGDVEEYEGRDVKPEDDGYTSE